MTPGCANSCDFSKIFISTFIIYLHLVHLKDFPMKTLSILSIFHFPANGRNRYLCRYSTRPPKSLNKLVELCERLENSEGVINYNGYGTYPNKNPRSMVQANNQPLCRSTKVQIIPREHRKRMLKIKIII